MAYGIGIHHLIKMVVASGISFICSKIDSGNAADAGNINQVISICR